MELDLALPESLKKDQQFIEKIGLLARELYGENDAAHGFDHALRVTRLALLLGQKEKADLELLVLAGLLHDIARHQQEVTGICHAITGAEIAGKLLAEQGYDSERIKLIQQMIQTHSFRDGSMNPTSLEEKILFDADKLDAIGAIGIGRAYIICGRRNQRLYLSGNDLNNDEDANDYSPVAEYHFKLKKIAQKMFTSSGREMAVHRHQFMEQFFDELQVEVEGRI